MNKNIFSILRGEKVTGLYVGNNSVDLVVLKGTLKGPKLIKFAQTYIYPKEGEKEETILEKEAADNGYSSGKIAQEAVTKKTKDDYIVEAIKRVFKENDVKTGSIITAIPSEDVMVRYFQMPRIPKQEWRSAIDFEAKRYIPFRMEDVASDFQVIQNKSSPGSMDVVFVAVKQKVIEHFVNLLERAGLKPLIIEPAPFSLIRAFNAAEQISSKINTAIVNIDERSANINILRNGVPYIIRDMPLDKMDSEAKSLEPIFEKILAEIKLSFDFYEKQFPSEAIDKIIIYSHVPLENWHELVGKELQIPVEVGDPLRGIKIKEGIVPPRLVVSFGLALRGISSPFVEVNLYKEKMLIYKRKELFYKMVFLEASSAVLLLIILKVLCMKAIAPLRNEFERTLSERPKVEISIEEEDVAGLESIKNKIQAKKFLMESIISSRTYFTARLMGLTELTPKNIWVTEIGFEEGVGEKDISKVFRKFTIKGFCVTDGRSKETDIINNFLLDLKDNKAINEGMSKADIVSVEKKETDEGKVASFEILFTGP